MIPTIEIRNCLCLLDEGQVSLATSRLVALTAAGHNIGTVLISLRHHFLYADLHSNLSALLTDLAPEDKDT